MTSQARIEALTALGFTARQAAFLVTVLLQGGVCVARQYCEFAGIAFGQRMHEFFQRLVARGYARPHSCGRHGARFYHLNSKTLYRAIGAAGHRYQQSMSLGAGIGRLILLDAVLADRETRWLDTDRAKSAHLRQCFVGYSAPGLTDFGACCSASIPAELRAMPMGVRGGDDGGELVLLFLVTTPKPLTFRAFLRRHTSVLSTVPRMTIRLVIPERLRWCEDDLRNAFQAHVVTASISSNSEMPTESRRAFYRSIRLETVIMSRRYCGLAHLAGTA
jgi:hypothetical protein